MRNLAHASFVERASVSIHQSIQLTLLSIREGTLILEIEQGFQAMTLLRVE